MRPFRRGPLLPVASSGRSTTEEQQGEDLSLFVPRRDWTEEGSAVPDSGPLRGVLRAILVNGSGCHVLSGKPRSGKTSLVNLIHGALGDAPGGPVRRHIEEHWFGGTFPYVWPERSPLVVRVELPAQYTPVDLLTRVVRDTCNTALAAGGRDHQHEALADCIREARAVLDWTVSVSASTEHSTEISSSLGATAELAMSILPSFLKTAQLKVKVNATLEVARRTMSSHSAALASKSDTVERLEVLFQRVADALLSSDGTTRWQRSEETRELLSKVLPDTIARQYSMKGRQLPPDFVLRIRRQVQAAWARAFAMLRKQSVDHPEPPHRQVLVVIDNVDRERHDEADRCLRSLQGIVGIPHCCFIVVASQQFFEDHLEFRPAHESGSLMDLCDSVVYLPPFRSQEVLSFLRKYQSPDGPRPADDELAPLADALLMASGGEAGNLASLIDAMSDYAHPGEETGRSASLCIRRSSVSPFATDDASRSYRALASGYSLRSDPRYEACFLATFQGLFWMKRGAAITENDIDGVLCGKDFERLWAAAVRNLVKESYIRGMDAVGQSSPSQPELHAVPVALSPVDMWRVEQQQSLSAPCVFGIDSLSLYRSFRQIYARMAAEREAFG
ncbi:MAG TPA: hypothetical protein VM537_09740 [Anaerolineae bacterium]|nr:hypothetical protein [Anaerolineae bacterium]